MTSHRDSGFKETSFFCVSTDLPNGFFRRGMGGVSNSHPPSRARSGVVHVTHCELESPPKMCLRSVERRCSRRHVHGGHPGRDRYGAYNVRLTLAHLSLVLARLLISRELPSLVRVWEA